MYPTDYDMPLTGLDWLEYYSAHNVYHPGVDFNKGYGNQDLGQSIYAPKDGEVIFINSSPSYSAGRGFGRFIIIKHDDAYTRYAHLQSIETRLGKVKEGDLIAKLGNSGTTYAHLHFEVFKENMASIQRNWGYKWCFYPSGKSKSWISEYYINPWEWLKEAPSVDEPMEEAKEYMKKNGIITIFNGQPKTDQEIALILTRWEKFMKEKYSL